jgi:hypothetical protein
MNEEYLNSIYSQNGGSATFGSYAKFTQLMLNNENYRKDVFNQLGGSQKFGGYDEYSSSLKKKRTYATRVWGWLKSNPTVKWFAAFPR